MLVRLFIIIFTLLAMTACATVSKPTVEKVASDTPVVSPAVEADKRATYSGLKRKVAIARFTNETRFGKSFFLDENNDRIGKQAVDILSSALMETEKFILLERADLKLIQKELKLGDVKSLKNMADYLIVGSVTEFGRKETGEVGFFSRTKKQTAFAKVHIRLIDVRTGEILFTEDGQGESFSEAGSVMGVGERAGYDSTINDKALEAAIVDLSSNVIENLMSKPWQSYIIAHEENVYIMSGGKTQGIKASDTFKVLRKGKTINNPQTNMPLTLPGKKIAEVVVLSTAGDTAASEVSFCSVIEGKIPTNDFSNLIVQEIK
ncbi:MAG: CsgG/HfaB family protein [Desulfovibrio sp.]